MDKKRTSTEEKNPKKIKLIQTTISTDRPLCKYGKQCYRKHPEHLKAFRHPTDEQSKIEEPQMPSSSATFDDDNQDEVENPPLHSTLVELHNLNEQEILKKIYQMDFPRDFFEFWKFSSTIDSKNPREVLKSLLNLELVGPFEVLDGTLNKCKTLPKMHLHFRYYYDTPEFMTLLRSVDEQSQYHIGYYRDSPDEMPAFVASNDALQNNRFKICGDNLFAAVHSYARSTLKSTKKTDFITKLEDFAKKCSFELEETTRTINARKKKVNCTLLNSLGMVVPVENDIGYRPVPMSKDELKRTCEKFCNANSDHARETAEEDLQHVITCIQFANDECDYGEGLEFGLNLFLFGSSKLHSRVLTLVPLAYQLLHRNLFGEILKDHIASGRSKSVEQLNEIEKNK